MTPEKAYTRLVSLQRDTASLNSALALLEWDQQIIMPKDGTEARSVTLASIAGLAHDHKTAPEVGELLDILEGSDLTSAPLSVEAVNIARIREDYDKALKVPGELEREFAKASSMGHAVWAEARKKNDWDTFFPYLEKLIDLSRERAEYLGYTNEPYDALLDMFEEGETAASVAATLEELREGTMKLLDRIKGSTAKPPVLEGPFPAEAQEAFIRETIEQLGFDFAKGRLDISPHPFSTTIHPGDMRITTRYFEDEFNSAFFGSVHEAGHNFYEMGLDPELFGTPMGAAVSHGVHESQSRLWENIVARSRTFWDRYTPEAQRHLPSLAGLSGKDMFDAVNRVEPSLIRVEADEVTYNLHIILRFELELALFRNEITPAELPEAWNAKMQELLGITPPDNADGVMQDVHWPIGAFGYFPSYSLGNVYSAQFYAAAQKELGDIEAMFAQGNFAPLLFWLKTNIHQEARRYKPRDLVKHVTGEELTPAYLFDYLNKKMGQVYGW